LSDDKKKQKEEQISHYLKYCSFYFVNVEVKCCNPDLSHAPLPASFPLSGSEGTQVLKLRLDAVA
jgi:hypothetical protein